MPKDWPDNNKAEIVAPDAFGDIGRQSMRGDFGRMNPETSAVTTDFTDKQGRDMATRTFTNGDAHYIRAYDKGVTQPPESVDLGQAGRANVHIERDGAATRARLQDIEVAPSYRESGTGSHLLREAEQVAQKNEAAEIYGLAPDEAETRAWYDRRGYQLRTGAQGGEEVFKPL